MCNSSNVTLHFTPLQNITDLIIFLSRCVAFMFHFFRNYSKALKESSVMVVFHSRARNPSHSLPRDSSGFCPFAFIKHYGEINSRLILQISFKFGFQLSRSNICIWKPTLVLPRRRPGSGKKGNRDRYSQTTSANGKMSLRSTPTDASSRRSH